MNNRGLDAKCIPFHVPVVTMSPARTPPQHHDAFLLELARGIVAYAGEDIEKPHHLPRDAELLLELPTSVRHFEVINDEWNMSKNP